MLNFLLLSAVASIASAQCSFSGDNIVANWTTSNGQLTINFMNSRLSNQQYTGIAFGSSMTNLEVIVFEVKNNKPIIVTGHTTAYGPPTTLDSTPNTRTQTLSYTNGMLMATVTRPLSLMSPRNNNLSGCSQWNFVAASPLNSDGSISKHTTQPKPMNVCPSNCRPMMG